MTEDSQWVKAIECGSLKEGQAEAISMPNGRTVAVFYWDGSYFATDNQCPHMGFPLVRGSIKNGVLMCDWHGRAFDLKSGGCFHSQCDDLDVFPTKIEDDFVWVEYSSERPSKTQANLRLLWEGLLGDDRWTVSKALALLLDRNADEQEVVDLILSHMGRHIASSHGPEGGEDVSRLVNGVHVSRRYTGEDRLIALTTAARSAAGDAHERNEIVPMPPPYDWEQTAAWVKEFSRDRQGHRIERCLFTAHNEGDSEKIIPLLYECVVQPYFMGFSQNLISLAYLAELVSTFGWENSSELVFWLGANIVGQGRSEPERFRRDAVRHMIKVEVESIDFSDNSSHVEFDEKGLVSALLDVDIVKSLEALAIELRKGIRLNRITTTLVLLAADRMARTPVSVDAGWENLTVELNVASAMRQALAHGGSLIAAQGLFHVAFQIFSDRWINISDRDLLDELETVDAPGKTENLALEVILDSVNTLNVEGVGSEVLGYLQAGYCADRLLHELGRAILRDDSGQVVLPTLRTVFEEWDNCCGDDEEMGSMHPARYQLIVGLARYATDIRSNTDDTSAAYAASRFAEGKTTVEIFE
ncbi:MAG: Rieske (2Fe-2S) protein [Gammaproteobacteria bacterium]|nr:Rieske (2Fe-2S) protein [Gammaproteobacteria bacterium]